MKTFIYTVLIQLIGFILLIVIYPTLTTIMLLILAFDLNLIYYLILKEIQNTLKELKELVK